MPPYQPPRPPPPFTESKPACNHQGCVWALCRCYNPVSKRMIHENQEADGLPCVTCNRKGFDPFDTCFLCGGTGRFLSSPPATKPELCSACRGLGGPICHTCHGSGKKFCRRCSGSGVMCYACREPKPKEEDYCRANRCGSAITEDCRMCRGSGFEVSHGEAAERTRMEYAAFMEREARHAANNQRVLYEERWGKGAGKGKKKEDVSVKIELDEEMEDAKPRGSGRKTYPKVPVGPDYAAAERDGYKISSHEQWLRQRDAAPKSGPGWKFGSMEGFLREQIAAARAKGDEHEEERYKIKLDRELRERRGEVIPKKTNNTQKMQDAMAQREREKVQKREEEGRQYQHEEQEHERRFHEKQERRRDFEQQQGDCEQQVRHESERQQGLNVRRYREELRRREQVVVGPSDTGATYGDASYAGSSDGGAPSHGGTSYGRPRYPDPEYPPPSFGGSSYGGAGYGGAGYGGSSYQASSYSSAGHGGSSYAHPYDQPHPRPQDTRPNLPRGDEMDYQMTHQHQYEPSQPKSKKKVKKDSSGSDAEWRPEPKKRSGGERRSGDDKLKRGKPSKGG